MQRASDERSAHLPPFPSDPGYTEWSIPSEDPGIPTVRRRTCFYDSVRSASSIRGSVFPVWFIEQLQKVSNPVILVMNKVDSVDHEAVFGFIDAYRKEYDFAVIPKDDKRWKTKKISFVS